MNRRNTRNRQNKEILANSILNLNPWQSIYKSDISKQNPARRTAEVNNIVSQIHEKGKNKQKTERSMAMARRWSPASQRRQPPKI